MKHEIILTYIDGNLSYARDEFWNQNKITMRDVMLEATDTFEPEELKRFIKVIFLP